MKRILWLLCVCLSVLFLLTGCSEHSSDTLADGYYTAASAVYDEYGWREYVTICVSDNRIVSVEYDARNPAGYSKSWDMQYMQIMNETDGTYPNQYTRKYSTDLINRQDPMRVDAVSGATNSYTSFQLLAEACLEQARLGDSSVRMIELPVFEEETAVLSAEGGAQ